MNFARFKSVVLNSVRFLVVAVACTLILFSNAYPAAAIGSSRSNTSQGETHLDEIYDKSEDILKGDNALSADKVKTEANRGINEVQGSADVKQMERPEDARNATSAAEQVERAFQKVTGRD
jgi:hypothetical protein